MLEYQGIVFVLLVLHVLNVDKVETSQKHEKTYIPGRRYGKANSSDVSNDYPLLFWWTSRLDASVRGSEGINQLFCPSYTCLITNDRNYFKDVRTRVLLFYGTDLEPDDLPFPRERYHEWALFHEESPMNNYILSHGTFIKLFNYTSTFRRESNFPITTQYIPSVEYITGRQPVAMSIKNEYRSKHGFAPILYVQSHCDVASDRDRYVKELMEHIQVDSYGKCLNNKKLPVDLNDPVEHMHNEKFLKFISRYKFHLSFENALCKDYMTEKLFRTLHVGSIPIYRGSEFVRDYMPDNNSVIVTNMFESPKELAEYINFLDSNDNEYLMFLKYKMNGITNKILINELNNRPYSTSGVTPIPVNTMHKPDMLNAFECYICEQAHQRMEYEKQTLSDKSLILKPQIASPDHLYCPQPYTAVGDPANYEKSDRWIQSGWIDDYWTGLDKAVAVERMLLNKETNPKTFNNYWRKVTYEFRRLP